LIAIQFYAILQNNTKIIVSKDDSMVRPLPILSQSYKKYASEHYIGPSNFSTVNFTMVRFNKKKGSKVHFALNSKSKVRHTYAPLQHTLSTKLSNFTILNSELHNMQSLVLCNVLSSRPPCAYYFI